MVMSILFAFLLGAGGDYVCDVGSAPDCLDRYSTWWLGLILLTLASATAAIILWVFPRTRPWGFVVGLLGTGGAAIAFTLAYGVPL
jgi:hypothetical protein